MKKKKNLTRPVAMAMAVSLAFGSIPYNTMADGALKTTIENKVMAGNPSLPVASPAPDATTSATYYTKPNWEARIRDNSRWKVEDSQTLVRVTTSDPVQMNDIDYDGMYINANGRYVIRLIYKEKTQAVSAVWHRALINFGDLDEYIDFGNSYVFGRDGKTKYTFDPVTGIKGRGFDLRSAVGDRTNNRKNLPINLVLKDGVTLDTLGKKNYIIQMRLTDANYQRVYSYAPGKTSMDYSTYTKTTSVSLEDNLNNLFIKGGLQADSNNATNQEFFMSEFIANPEQYKDEKNLGIIRTQYMGQRAGSAATPTVGDQPIAFTQVFDANLLNYLKEDDDGNVAYTNLLTVGRVESPYAKKFGIKRTDINEITVEGGKKLAYIVIAPAGFTNKTNVKVVGIPQHDQYTMLSGFYITAIDYVVDKSKFEDTFSSKYTRKLDYSTMSGWTNPNDNGWPVYTINFSNDYVVQEGDSFMVDAGADAKGKQIMIQVGGEQAILRRPQGYYNGYNSGKAALDAFEEIADGVFQFTIGEGTTVKKGKPLKVYMPYTTLNDAPDKINFLQIHNGTKLNEGAATLTLQKDRNINMHLYKQGKKGYFVLRYTKADGNQGSLKFEPKITWSYDDKDGVMTGASNKATLPSGGNFYIDTTKLMPGTDIIVDSYGADDNKIDSETSWFKYIPLNKSDETVKLLTWTDHSDKRSVLSINKSLYTPYQVLFTNDYADGVDDFYKNPRVLPSDNAKFNTETTKIVGYTKYDSGKVRTLYEGDKLLFGKVEADGNEYDKDGNLTKDLRKPITLAKKDIFDAQFAEDNKTYKVYEYTVDLAKMLPYHSDDKTETKLTLLKDMKFVSTASDGSSLPSDLIETRVRARVLFDTTDGQFADGTKKVVKIVPDNTKFYGEAEYAANGFEGANADTNTGDKFPDAPKLQGKNFLGWVTKEGKDTLGKTIVSAADFNKLPKEQVFTNTTPVEKHLVVYAIYSEDTVVTFDANGGTFEGGKDELNVKAEGSTVTKPTDPKRDGYTFKGWADSKDATEANVTDFSNIDASKTVYAVWEQKADKKLELNAPAELVPVSDKTDLTAKEKDAVKQAVIDANPTLNLTKDDITVGSDGKVTVKTTDGKTGELTPEQTVKQKEVINNINPPAPPVEVKNPDALDDTEKGKVKDAIIKANPDLNLKPEEVTVDDNGKVTINQGGKTGTVPADKTVVEESKIIKLNKPTPVEVKDVNNLTPAEKEAVKDAVVAANSGLSRDKISVDGNGNVTVTDGDKTGKLEGKDTVKPFDRTGKTLNDPKEKVEVSDKNNLTKAEKEAVREAVKAANPDLNFKDEEIQVDDNGKVTVPMGTDGSGNTIYKEIAPEKTVKKDDTTKTISLKAPKVTVVGDPTSLTDDEKAAVKQAVLDANNTSGLTLNDITVANDGSVTVTKGNKTGMLAQADTVVKKLDSPKIASDEDGKVVVGPKDERTSEIEVTYKDTNDAEQKVTAKKDPTTGEWKLDPKVDGVKINKDSGLISIPASKIKNGTEVKAVAKDGANTSEENTIKSEDKQAPARPELKENEDGSVTITPPKDADTATVTIKYGDKEVIATKDGNNWTFNPADSGLNVDQGGNIVIPADKLSPGTKVSAQAEDANGNKSSEPEIITKTQAEKIDPVVPAKTPVADPTNLTKEEKDTVKKAIEDANKDKFPQGTTVEVDETGKATIKYPDGSTDTIPAVSLVEKVDKTELQEEADKNKNDAIKNSDKYKNADQTKKDAYDTALDKANTVLNDPNAKQKDVDEALKQLKEAEAALDGQATP
ncbi:InlB B-repeat-containing protein, partial [Peptoniphilus sp. BV3AC2]|uniref:InlB B-repeat-containing protein n=1 Tax=Peptoniphilus sp. BV3AC2 TaxID=1111133 RepID=UPI0003B869C3